MKRGELAERQLRCMLELAKDILQDESVTSIYLENKFGTLTAARETNGKPFEVGFQVGFGNDEDGGGDDEDSEDDEAGKNYEGVF